jgi:alkanesulfonate monooxygenase SsuD/methylene tetrahydromethanopterin reductase-like flavin-dependent oxidoreductase (luciferase family)
VCATGRDASADAVRELKHWDLDPAQDVAAVGTAADIALAARRWVTAGADTIVLQPAADTDIESFAAFIGSEVQPLLNG